MNIHQEDGAPQKSRWHHLMRTNAFSYTVFFIGLTANVYGWFFDYWPWDFNRYLYVYFAVAFIPTIALVFIRIRWLRILHLLLSLYSLQYLLMALLFLNWFVNSL